MSKIKEEVIELLLNDVNSETLIKLAEKTVEGVLESYDVTEMIKKTVKPEIEKAVKIIVKEKGFQQVLCNNVRDRLEAKIEILTIDVLDELVHNSKKER